MTEPTPFIFKSESDEPAPAEIAQVDDRLTADQALRRVKRGEWLEYVGDYRNARQLLQAMARRLPKPRPHATALEVFRAERKARALEHDTLSHVLVALDGNYQLTLKNSPDVARACRQSWGRPQGPRTLVALKTLVGMMGAAQWREKGLAVRGLTGLLETHYGVFVPTRTEYLDLLPKGAEVKGRTVFDIGTGTGVLSLLLLQRGAESVVATDIDARAVACARGNAEHFNFAEKMTVKQTDLYPDGRADIVICNPPWVPEPPKNRVDRGVFDEDSDMLKRFLHGLRSHLTPDGTGYLILSDLAILLGLREEGWVEQQFDEAELLYSQLRSSAARHPKAKKSGDPLQAVRAQETTSVYVLKPKTRPTHSS